MEKCECCNEEKKIVGIASIPGMPMSIAWCQECLESGVIPYWAAVSNTALVGSYENSAEWWKELVDLTLKKFNKTMEEFTVDVTADIENMNRYFEEQEQSAESPNN